MEKITNNWQKDIYKALENEGTFDMKNWKTKSEIEDNGLGFMEDVAYYKREYDYLNSLNLVNRGFCPITGEKIDDCLNYAIYGRTIFVSEKALELGKLKKQQFREKFQNENPNFQSNLKQAKSFLDNTKPYSVKPRYDNITFFSSLFLSGYLSYKIIKPISFWGYIITFVLFILLFNLADWLRKKI